MIPRRFLIGFVLAVMMALPALSQSNQFRDTKAHLGMGVGVFTYHGPIDLLQPNSKANFVRESDPGLFLLGSFPITRDRFFFRGMLLFTNFSTKDGKQLVGTGSNEFLTKHLFMFEPEIVVTLRAGSKARVLPYVFTGFGATTADLFSNDSKGRVDLPTSGVPGPERTAYHLPFGLGVDVAFNGCWSFFAEASYRWHINYVWRNERDYEPHNSSLVMAGLRGCIERKPLVAPPPAYIPPPLTVPSYQPPLPRIPRMCALRDLNSIYFRSSGDILDDVAVEALDENVEALLLNPTCCVEIVGYTSGNNADIASLRLARQRAETVARYYRENGILADRIHIETEVGEVFCPKGKDGKGCLEEQQVATNPFDCSQRLR